jgi:DNA-binding HxlR family transcriptional regulator
MDALPSTVTFDRTPSTPVGPQLSTDALERLLCQPVRQAILRGLLERGALSFSEIKRLLTVSDGNLSAHARKLEDAGLLCNTKGFRGRVPRTEYRLTAVGLAATERVFGTPAPQGM